ncbi:hypothetical protein HDU93_003444 [Gonapodya sp. JEL0774]|nr:hypothetical protein HDU93_003444 [Gonapodya sp. JEL0774]
MADAESPTHTTAATNERQDNRERVDAAQTGSADEHFDSTTLAMLLTSFSAPNHPAIEEEGASHQQRDAEVSTAEASSHHHGKGPRSTFSLVGEAAPLLAAQVPNLLNMDRRTAITTCKLLKESTNFSARDLATFFGVSYRTIYAWLSKPVPPTSEEVANDPQKYRRQRRPKKLNPLNELEVRQWLLEEPARRQADAVIFVKERFGLEVTQQTISNIMKRGGQTLRLVAQADVQYAVEGLNSVQAQAEAYLRSFAEQRLHTTVQSPDGLEPADSDQPATDSGLHASLETGTVDHINVDAVATSPHFLQGLQGLAGVVQAPPSPSTPETPADVDPQATEGVDARKPGGGARRTSNKGKVRRSAARTKGPKKQDVAEQAEDAA